MKPKTLLLLNAAVPAILAYERAYAQTVLPDLSIPPIPKPSKNGAAKAKRKKRKGR